MSEQPELKRAISLPGILFLGIGTMVGAGFYALLGEVAGAAGTGAPLAFLGAGLLALINAFVFAEMVSRYPVSAGVARYVAEGFAASWQARLTGWLVIATGVVSAGTLTVATAGFLRDLAPLPEIPAILLVGVALGLVAAWGIGQSVALVAGITLVEVAALVAVFAVNADHLADWQPFTAAATGSAALAAPGLFAGAFLAFYAFIGFEDMVSLAEETRAPRRRVPIALLASVLIVTVIYVLVSAVAVVSVEPAVLARSRTPVARLVEHLGDRGTLAIVIVSLLTGINGALVQILMASRVAHGMARQGDAPAWLGQVHPRTRTPLAATAAAAAVILALALFLPLDTLARATSFIILVIFGLVSLSLWRIKGAEDGAPDDAFVVPRWVPLLAGASCLAALAAQAWFGLAGGP